LDGGGPPHAHAAGGAPPPRGDHAHAGARWTTYLGWSSWNAFGDLSTHKPPIGSKALLEIADIIVSIGLRDVGYVNFLKR